ncbi:TPA: hypothetical protein ACNV18_000063 [Pseudomonas putida]|jgi:hypothetical protein|uniref:hypothetical protein n=1 Tax=Pseudomonas TaxID=286 RepID=UPI000D97B285|nr:MULTISPECIES: hypothetical protein [Pseudomonas]MCE0946510.1 hypothetical protein [Pseudomonas asiatica]MCE1004952.1 hypothetical protein [Pseudomonas sp. NMI1173_11]MCE1067601.1 hypothetical protein [Pseudomonas asiatica]PYD14484.1 hypothetical protein DND47_16535 [Pseudomonas syringae pv. syringae]
MAKRLAPDELYARFIALKEAADHLRLLEWTDDKTEREQGLQVAELLGRQANEYLERAQAASAN